MPNLVRVPTGYGGKDPATIFAQDDNTKTLRAIAAGDILTGAGYQFGQEKVVAPTALTGYSLGPDITSVDQLNPAASLDSLKTDLNSYQNELFNSAPVAGQRQASQLTDEIAKSLADAEAERKSFQDLRTKYNSLDTFSLFDEYNKLRESQGVPQAEKDLLATRDAERNLETDLRGASGNAAPVTEALFQANLAERQRPLLLKESTLNDRLALASSYIQTALSYKEKDSAAAKDAIEKAIALTQDSISAINSRVSNLNVLRDAVQQQVDTGISRAKATIDTLKESGALAKLPANDLHQLELDAGMPPGSLSAIAKAVSDKSEVIATETDDGGNLHVITRTPEGVITTTTVPNVGKKTNATDGTGSGGILDGNGNPVKLTTGQQTDVADIDTLSTLLDNTLALGNRIGFAGTGGAFKGSIDQFLAKNFGRGTAEEEELRNYIGNIRGTLAKLRGGTSFTANEEKLLNSYTPSINDNPLTIQAKVNSLKSYLATKRSSIITAAGGAAPAVTSEQQINDEIAALQKSGQIAPASQPTEHKNLFQKALNFFGF